MFVERLSAANLGRGHCENGWSIQARQRGSVIPQKTCLDEWNPTATCLSPEDQRPAPGSPPTLIIDKELRCISPGFYTAVSNEFIVQCEQDSLMRLYWNITAEGAVLLMLLGLSGLGSLFLQLHARSTPSMLFLNRNPCLDLPCSA